MWYKVWIWGTVLVYLWVRTKWREDVREKQTLMDHQEAVDAKNEQEWNRFVKAYQKGASEGVEGKL